MTAIRSFKAVVQTRILPSDTQWQYEIQNLPRASKLDDARLIKVVSFLSSQTEQQVELQLECVSSNRITRSEKTHLFLSLNVANFRLREPGTDDNGAVLLAPSRESAAYLARLLKTGIVINTVHYNFFGHSNSQLKSRSCLLFAASKDVISSKIEALGDFSKMKSVAKKAKRIGLLFSSADMAIELDPDRCEDIDDIAVKDYVFTDGCGLISEKLARHVVQRRNIVFRNRRYLPSVFQIRYRGYKGVLTLATSLKGRVQVQFRQSMKKFSATTDASLSIVECSKPYTFGYLNDEIVLLLHALGISCDTLCRKQNDYLSFLSQAFSGDMRSAFQFLSYQSEVVLAERLLMDGIESVLPALKRLVTQERAKMLNKYEEQRCRIMIPQSRLLFGVCDPSGRGDAKGKLKPGTCFVRITQDGDGQARTLINTEVLVTRNPCLHPGDLQKFKVVDVLEFSHLVDCIVFPTCGSRPSADLMSGGDLDGDKFFVTWDPDIIPSQISQPAAYPGVKERLQFGQISDDDRAEFFARYTNVSLGRVKNLYLKWARLRGPMSPECQQLNRLFSQCVDGNRIRVPADLEDPPEPGPEVLPFVLDVLHDAAKATTDTTVDVRSIVNHLGDAEDVMNLLSSREKFALSEFQLVQCVLRRCSQKHEGFEQYAHFFNYAALSEDQQAWLLNGLPPSKCLPSLVRNGLLQSDLAQPAELHNFGLDHAALHWKPVFMSTVDRMGRFLNCVSRASELFHKKLIIIQADERLMLMIYIPAKIYPETEVQVDASVRVFAVPRSSGSLPISCQVTPTKTTYRLYCDNSSFQLYQGKRQNTFVFLKRGPSNDAAINDAAGGGERRRHKQRTIDEGINFDCRASVALDKIGKSVQTHVGRMNRAGILAAEMYVISNRDVASMRVLDQWLHYVDTQEVLPLFENTSKEYHVATLNDVDWKDYSPTVGRIVLQENLADLTCATLEDIEQVLRILNEAGKKTKMRTISTEVVRIAPTDNMPNTFFLLQTLLHLLPDAPHLCDIVIESRLYAERKPLLKQDIEVVLPRVLRELVLSVNAMGPFVKRPFMIILQEIAQISIQEMAQLVELVALTVEEPEFALDLLLECLQPHSSRLLIGRPSEMEYLIRNLVGIAMNHIDEALDSSKLAKSTLTLVRDGVNEGYEVVKAKIRIDVAEASPKVGDHIRLIAAGAPQNAPTMQAISLDTIVIKSEQGSVSFRCLHRPPSFLAECSWQYRYCGSFVTTKTMFDAVTKLYAEKYVGCGIYRQLIGYENSPSPPVSGGSALYHCQTLNGSQNTALNAAMCHPLTFLWGPPGTGKTYTVVTIIKEMLRTFPKSRFLITAPTHNAVDNILRRLVAEPDADVTAFQPVRVSTDARKVSPELLKYTCDAMVGKDLSEGFAGRREAQRRVKQSRLVFTTCAGAGLGLLRTEDFDVVLVDEASQQTEPETLIPLTKGCQRAILVGDHVQLRATVGRHAETTGFNISLFERYYTGPEMPGVAKVMLDTQYRMHPDICEFSSKAFYDGRLQSWDALKEVAVPPSQFPWPRHARKVFVQCDTFEDIGRKSKSNHGQVQMCRTICTLLTSAPIPHDVQSSPTISQRPDIAILTPYTAQRELLKQAILGHTVSSIDGYQGREADLVVFCTVRSNAHYDIGFVNDLRRLNVAITRAKAGLIIVGNRATLTGRSDDETNAESKMVWKSLLDECSEVRLPIA